MFTTENKYLLFFIYVFVAYFRSFDAEKHDASINLRSAFDCMSWFIDFIGQLKHAHKSCQILLIV